MIRVLVYVILLAVLATGLSWLADRPGNIELVWQGYQIKTSLMAFVLATVALVAALIILWSLIRAILRTPDGVSTFFRSRRRSKGLQAVTQGMIAVGSGDVRLARKTAAEATRILGDEPLALLLRAQAAQLAGDRPAAETAFKAMLESPETKPLALRGLFVEARRRGDAAAARAFAAEAVKSTPQLPWAGTALLEFQSVAKDWDSALLTLARNAENKLIDKETARRHRAVLLTARAQAEVDRDRARAKSAVLEAVKLAPGLVPAAVLAARFYSDGGDFRRASRILEAAWRLNPHPDIADAYMNVRYGDSARDRFDRIRTLAALKVSDPESAVALARAALVAREYKIARGALAPLLAHAPTERVCLLMAEIEETENGATGRVREWLSRAVRAPRDAVWTADGIVSDVWLPVSPVSGRIDAFEWKTPVERIGGPIVDPADAVLADIDEPAQIEAPADLLPAPVDSAPPVTEAPPPIAIEVKELKPEPVATNVAAAEQEAPPADSVVKLEPAPKVEILPKPDARTDTAKNSAVETIIASHPTPDDPGPDPEPEHDAPRRRVSLFR